MDIMIRSSRQANNDDIPFKKSSILASDISDILLGIEEHCGICILLTIAHM